jgi:hypothetical protein
MEGAGTAPPFLTLVLDGVSGQLHALAALPLGKETPLPLHRRLGGSRSQSGCCGEWENVLPLPGIKSSLWPVAILSSSFDTVLYSGCAWLHNAHCNWNPSLITFCHQMVGIHYTATSLCGSEFFGMTFLGTSRYWNQAGLNTNANLCLVMTALFLFLVSHIQSGPQEI